MTTAIDPCDLLISRLKLDALKRRRVELAERYGAIEAQAAAAADDGERIRLLQRGLAELRSGSERLHPEAALLSELLELDPGGALLTAHRVEWTRKLARELDLGRARADYTYLFGCLVDEWLSALDRPRPAAPEAEAAVREVIGRFGTAAPAVDLAFVEETLTTVLGPARFAFGHKLREEIADEIETPFTADEVEGHAGELAGSPYRSAALRRQASQVAQDETRRGEYASALNLLLDAVDTWDWAADGVAAGGVLAGDQHRVYLEEDLLTALFLQGMGARWASALKVAMGEISYRSQPKAFTREGGDAEDEVLRTLDTRADNRLLASASDRSGVSHYVQADRVLDSPGAIDRLIIDLHAWMRAERGARPARPFTVVRTDVRALGPSLSPEVVDRVLATLGTPPKWRAFIGRFQRVPVRHDGAIHRADRGVFPDHPLGLALADLVLLVADLAVFRDAKVRPLRVLDEIVLAGSDPAAISRAWAALRRAITAMGLQVHEGKTGAVAVGGPLSPDLPRGPVRIGLVELRDDGSWRPDEAGVDRAVAALRDRIAEDQPILTSVAVYSSGARDLVQKLAPFVVAVDGHLQAVARAAARAQNDLFAPGHGIIEELSRRAGVRFGEAATARIPRAAWYWPLTAGGMGLYEPCAQLGGLVGWRQENPYSTGMPRPVAEGKPLDRAWGAFFVGWSEGPQPRRPLLTATLEGLLGDFVRRGDELLGRKPDDEKARHRLSFYWQWVVALHGPELIERFGSFRFVEALRVPFGLLVRLKTVESGAA